MMGPNFELTKMDNGLWTVDCRPWPMDLGPWHILLSLHQSIVQWSIVQWSIVHGPQSPNPQIFITFFKLLKSSFEEVAEIGYGVGNSYFTFVIWSFYLRNNLYGPFGVKAVGIIGEWSRY